QSDQRRSGRVPGSALRVPTLRVRHLRGHHQDNVRRSDGFRCQERHRLGGSRRQGVPGDDLRHQQEGGELLPQQDLGQEEPAPRLHHRNDLCLVTCEKELHQMTFEEKELELYDWDEKKNVPTKVMVATEMIGKPIALGILKKLENKSEK